jgi:hypothetical protein
MDNSNGLT